MSDDRSGQVSQLLQHWIQGDQGALTELAPAVYQELRRLAHYHLKSERADHTLQSTALVNEAFMRLIGSRPEELKSRAHFVAVASNLMRRILVDYARARNAGKRDGGLRIDVDALAELPGNDDQQLVALDDALESLAQMDERLVKVVDMKFFGGLTTREIAGVLGLSVATVERDWSAARVWLYRQMRATNVQ
jgi:RNA polymerase sigma factor (TIGR02999 family)